jgi:hypothetical protein
MTEFFSMAVSDVYRSRKAFCRFITANDANLTSHQAGFYVPKEAASLLFDELGVRGSNKERFVRIRWQDDFTTDSRFIYYGTGTRNEYRITRFGQNFPFLAAEYVGSLLVICRMDVDFYTAYVLERDEDIDEFFSTFNLVQQKTNHLIDPNVSESPDAKISRLISDVVRELDDFPQTEDMSRYARNVFNEAFDITPRSILANPDDVLLKWTDTEYSLFTCIEEKVYQSRYSTPFENCASLISFSNQVLNRRKSRAGKSLEHHLSSIFKTAQLRFDEQAITESTKKPDFLFPGAKEYQSDTFPAEDLTFLGAKTTCKDRWRQVLDEAKKIDVKYLFTLQPSIAVPQLEQMKAAKVVLVIPEANRTSFDVRYRDGLFSLKQFMYMVKEKQDRHFSAIII